MPCVGCNSGMSGACRHLAGSPQPVNTRSPRRRLLALRAFAKNGSMPAGAPSASHNYDYDLVIIGAGVGGHGAALHAVEQGLKVAIIEGHDIGGTCVNRCGAPQAVRWRLAWRQRQHV